MMKLESVYKELHSLSADLDVHEHQSFASLDLQRFPQLVSGKTKILIISCGDGHCAGLASRSKLIRQTGLECLALTPEDYLSQMRHQVHRNLWSDSLVVLCSYSGKTAPLLQVAQQLDRARCTVVSITGKPDSQLSLYSDVDICYSLPEKEPAPGIRSYQATLLAINLLSMGIKGLSLLEFKKTQLTPLKQWLDTQINNTEDMGIGIAHQLNGHESLMFVGATDSYGTAKFCASKFLEITGIPSYTVEAESWMHAERFASRNDIPMIVISQDLNTEPLTQRLLALAIRLRKHIILVKNKNDQKLKADNLFVFEYENSVSQDNLPLICYTALTMAAYHLGKALRQVPFSSNPPNMIK